MASGRQKKKGTVSKVSVSLLAEHADWLRESAQKQGRAPSAVLGDAVETAKRVAAQRELVAWLQKGSAGPVTAEHMEAVRAEWRQSRSDRTRRRSA